MTIKTVYLKSISFSFFLMVVVTVIFYLLLKFLPLESVNPFLQLAFWCIGIPALAYNSSFLWKDVNLVSSAIISSLLFFGFVYFMTFKQFDTDFLFLFKYSAIMTFVSVPLYYIYSKWYDRKFVNR